jgi:hypothetical protein
LLDAEGGEHLLQGSSIRVRIKTQVLLFGRLSVVSM